MLREKRWILFCLLFAFTGLFAAPTQAAENTDPVYQGMKYRLDAATEEITITGYTADVAWNLEIPLEIDGKKVTAIAKYAFSESRIRSVTLNENMISIGAGAFYQCKDLEQVKMADSITTIGEMAFFECPNLYSIRIPGGVKEIGYDAFKNCERLSYVTIETGVQTISHCVFSGCSSLEEIAIPDSVTSIGARAFENCTKLKKVDMPDQVTVIGTDKEVCDKAHWGPLASYDPNAYKNASKNEGGTFQGCSALTEIHLPKNLETIHINTFKDCSALKTITIPGSVKTIEEYAFQGCRGLLELTISDGVDKIDIYAFKDCTSLTKVEIPDSVTAMGSSREVSMPIGGSVKPPDKDMGGIFEGCTALASIRLSKNAEYIYPNTFTGCLNLNHVEIP
ncbi:MAG TPA: hypothetical protein DF613_09700, partial [Lachnospiraceae bacterium]|nr:hypothetical protein [Lachnospiraceae bacterium]